MHRWWHAVLWLRAHASIERIKRACENKREKYVPEMRYTRYIMIEENRRIFCDIAATTIQSVKIEHSTNVRMWKEQVKLIKLYKFADGITFSRDISMQISRFSSAKIRCSLLTFAIGTMSVAVHISHVQIHTSTNIHGTKWFYLNKCFDVISF